MRFELKWMVVGLSATMVLMTGCGSTAPASTAPASTAAPTKAAALAATTTTTAAPTAVPAQAQATTAPAKKSDYPAKGKSITLIVPFAAGGDMDMQARTLGAQLEREIGSPIVIENKGAAGGQAGMTDLATAKPDGYTFGYTPLPKTPVVYLDPSLKAAFKKSSFEPIANHTSEASLIAVKADSPYKDFKEIMDAAKANPGTVKAAMPGILGPQHLGMIQLQKITNTKFALVMMDGAGPTLNALLGGHVDMILGSPALLLSQIKGGTVRILGVVDKKENQFVPGVKTLEAQGYPVAVTTDRVLSLPAGTPRDVFNALSDAVKKTIQSDEHKKRMEDAGSTVRYMNPTEVKAFWDEQESQLGPLMELAKER